MVKIVNDSFTVRTKRRCEMIDITSDVRKVVGQSGAKNGDVIVYCPHTTAGITINENADPDVPRDILLTLSELIPQDRPEYRHCEANSDSHVKSSLVGCSEQVLVKGSKLCLGTWQAIYFCEFDGPRTRQVLVQVRGE